MVVCLVTHGREVGVDVEDTMRPGRTVELAESHFAPGEVQALHALAPERRRRRFFEYWTLKEAYIKARGMGLAIELDKFAFELDRNGEIAVWFDSTLGDVPSAWSFALGAPNDRHLVGYAIERRDADVRVTWGELNAGDQLELAGAR
jgi:4'-phosphopantetheinyl transferase